MHTKKIKMEIHTKAQRSPDTTKALAETYQLLEQAQADQTSLDEIFGEGLDEFCNSVLSDLPQFTLEERYARLRKKARRHILLSFTAVLSVCAILLWYFGIFSFWSDGMWALVGETQNHSLLEKLNMQPASVDIDLSDFDSNAGKVLLDRDGCRIVVQDIYTQEGNDGSIWYCVAFHSYAAYNLRETVYFWPRLYQEGQEGRLDYTAFAKLDDKDYNVGLRADGPHGREYARFDVYLINLPSDYDLSKPVKVTFTLFDVYQYIRTSWGR